MTSHIIPMLKVIVQNDNGRSYYLSFVDDIIRLEYFEEGLKKSIDFLEEDAENMLKAFSIILKSLKMKE